MGVRGSPLPPGHMHRSESFLNGACVHSHVSTVLSVICICLLTWGKKCKNAGEALSFGVGNSAVYFSVCSCVSQCNSSTCSQNISWF